MSAALEKVQKSPLQVRVVPFVIFLALTACQGQFGATSQYWFYLAKVIVGAWAIWLMRPFVPEMRWQFGWEAVIVGIIVFVLWVGLDPFYPSGEQLVQNYLCPVLKKLDLESWCPQPSESKSPWNPFASFPTNQGLAWVIAMGRVFGSTLVVPPLEEVFYRSFLYRYVVRPDFQNVSLNTFKLGPFLIVAVIFGLAHREWLPGILCAAAYQGLVIRRNRLGDAIVAHAITNFLLGLWVIWRDDWHFW
ncbi:MAG: CAAX prenyl protease-related protein [Verrucomicrobiales bacterium]|nr:CAAX prenyl protease-related protein [Verrucomicrobiales bacterium]